MIVVDASVLGPLVSGVRHDAISRASVRLSGEALVAPEIVYLEVLSMVKKALRRKTLSSSRALEAVTDLVTLAMETVPHRELVPRVWELRDNLTPYDAAYVALAEARDIPLLTADARLAKATGPVCEIELIR